MKGVGFYRREERRLIDVPYLLSQHLKIEGNLFRVRPYTVADCQRFILR